MAFRIMPHFNGKPCRTCGETLRYTHGSKQCVACSRRVKNAYRKTDRGVEMVKRWRLQKEYGITLEDYESMLIEQNNKCLICNVNFNGTGWDDDTAVVDHDHSTDKVRGLLCNICNRGLGMFKDNKTLLDNAIKYLERAG